MNPPMVRQFLTKKSQISQQCFHEIPLQITMVSTDLAGNVTTHLHRKANTSRFWKHYKLSTLWFEPSFWNHAFVCTKRTLQCCLFSWRKCSCLQHKEGSQQLCKGISGNASCYCSVYTIILKRFTLLRKAWNNKWRKDFLYLEDTSHKWMQENRFWILSGFVTVGFTPCLKMDLLSQ